MGPLSRTFFVRATTGKQFVNDRTTWTDRRDRLSALVSLMADCSRAVQVSELYVEKLALLSKSQRQQSAEIQRDQERRNVIQACAQVAIEVRAMIEQALGSTTLGEDAAELGLLDVELKTLREVLGYEC